MLKVLREAHRALGEDVDRKRLKQGLRLREVVGERRLGRLIALLRVRKDAVLVVVELAKAQGWLDRTTSVMPINASSTTQAN